MLPAFFSVLGEGGRMTHSTEGRSDFHFFRFSKIGTLHSTGYIFMSSIPKFRRKRAPAHVLQSFHLSKNSSRPKYYYFLVKIGKKLHFTLKNNKHKEYNFIFAFEKQFLRPPKIVFWVFEEKPPKNVFYLCSALIPLLSVFLKMQEKSY